MRKTAIALISLVPALAFAHSGNDLSHGHAHYWFSWHHFLGMITMALAAAAGIWYFTKPKEEPKKARVRVHKD